MGEVLSHFLISVEILLKCNFVCAWSISVGNMKGLHLPGHIDNEGNEMVLIMGRPVQFLKFFLS